MASLVRGHIPNLVQGISQQVQELRLNSQLQECENMLPSVSRGLVRRPPLEYNATLPFANVSDDAAWHNIDRDMDEQYVLVIGDNNSIQVYDLDGVPQTLTTKVPEVTIFNTNVALFSKGAGGKLSDKYNTFVDYGDIAERQKSGSDLVFTVFLGNWDSVTVESASDAIGSNLTTLLNGVTSSGKHTITANLSGNFIRVTGTGTTETIDRTVISKYFQSNISDSSKEFGFIYFAGYFDRHVSGTTITTTVSNLQGTLATLSVQDGGVGGSNSRVLRDSTVAGVSTTTVDPSGSYISGSASFTGVSGIRSVTAVVQSTEYKTGSVAVDMVFTEEESESVNLGYLDMPEGVAAKDAFEFLTIADYTFILNKTMVVEATASLTPERPKEVIAFAKEAVLDSDVSLSFDMVDDDSTVTIETKYSFPKSVGEGPVLIGTEDCAFHLNYDFKSAQTGGAQTRGARAASYALSGDVVTAYDDTEVGTGNRGFNNKTVSLDGGGSAKKTFNGWEANEPQTFPSTPHNVLAKVSSEQVDSSVLYSTSVDLDADESWTVTQYSDSRAGGQLIVIEDTVSRFSDLPVQAWHGVTVQVTGDGSSDLDDYYVAFEADDGVKGKGRWVEAAASGISMGLDPRTMPYALTRMADGTFMFGSVDWGNRVVGDASSNPHPSFVGHTLSNLSFFKSRLLFLASDNVVMSEVNDFFNFYRTTVSTVLDGDPIDVRVADANVVNLVHAVPYNNTIVGFSDRAQYNINSGDASLTPATVSITPAAAYGVSFPVAPIALGSSVFFATDRGQFSGIREYFPAPEQEGLSEALDITGHCPRYLPLDINQISGNTREDIILVLPNSPNSRYLYVYNYFWNGEQKIQDSWTRWDFGPTVEVLRVFFLDSVIHLVIRVSNADDDSFAVGLASIDISEGYMSDINQDSITHLDLRVNESEVANLTYVSNTTFTIPFPYDPTMTYYVVGRGDDLGMEPATIQTSEVSDGTQLEIVGEDWSNRSFYVGVINNSKVVISNQYVREGNDNLVVKAYKLLMKYFTIGFSNTDSFNTVVMHKDVGVDEMDILRLSSGEAVVAQEGDFRFELRGNSTNLGISFENNGWRPFTLVNAQWEADFQTFSQSVG